MEKFAKKICENKNIILIITGILFLLSIVGIKLTKINYDILVYLPKEIETVRGQNILTNDFGMGAYSVVLADNLNSKEKEYTSLSNELKEENLVRNLLINNLAVLNKDELTLKNQIDILKDAIESDSKLPYAVKNVLNNHRLSGIHNILGKVIETEEKYSTAIDIALGYTSNVVIVDNENNAKDAISYLKQNGLGRVTFYPINLIKPKGVDPNTLNKIKNESGFLGIASDLVKYNPIYRGIVLNALGNTLVVDNINIANIIARMINHTYRIVTLDGELLNAGGSITGGNNKSG